MEPAPDDLAMTLTDLAIAVLREKSLSDDLARLTRLTVSLIRSSTAVSVAMLIDGKPTTTAVSDHVALELDLVQYEEDEGPCIAALAGSPIRVGFLQADERFPHFAVGAADQRINSVLSIPIRYEGEVIGTMNIYSRAEDAFGEEDTRMAEVVATAAANAIAKTELLTKARTIREQLQANVDEATLVAQAQGVLMAIQQCSAQQAEALIRNAADTNTESLIDAATRIIAVASSTDGALRDGT
jgi:GAF domain-containing protein